MTTIIERFDEVQQEETNRSFGSLASDFGNLPLKQLGYHSHVVGLSVRTTIRQTFYNPFDEVIEATYIFPIEGEQAVVDCEMWVAGRVIRASLKERGEARRDYTRAIQSGYRAALLEENRPETFSMKVGNIPPGEAIQVRIETIGALPVVHGEWTLRLPLVVAPRYTSGLPLPFGRAGAGVERDTDQVPDASTVSPPTWLPGFASPVDLRLSVDLEMGSFANSPTWARDLKSSLHSVIVQNDYSAPSRVCRVSVLPGERIDRDFILRGKVDASDIQTSLTLESGSSDKMTFALNIVPPRVERQVPRNIVFLLDRSGSMEGWKMVAARRGVSRLVDSLLPDDRFQAIAFDDRVESFQSAAKKDGVSLKGWHDASDARRYEAVRWLGRIETRGGTEMGKAIEHALKTFHGSSDGQPFRQNAIVLVTDGQVTGEDSLLRLLGTIPESWRPRLFCLGVDRAVNGSVLQRLAKFTGGTYELAESEKRLDEVLHRFGQEMGSPAISHLTIDCPTGSSLSLAPTNANTLYSGRGVSIYGQTARRETLTLSLTGSLPNGQPWRQDVTADAPRDGGKSPILLPLWGKARVRELEDELASRGNRDRELTREIIDCSLACHVLSRLTAFVAVDDTERVSNGELPHATTQPVSHPEGWAYHPALHRSMLIRARRPEVPTYDAPRFSKYTASHIAEQLAQRQFLSKQQLADAKRLARETGKEMVDVLLQWEFVSAEDIARTVAQTTNTVYVDLKAAQISQDVVQIMPECIARENLAFPVADSPEALTIAVSDPSDLEMIEKLQFVFNKPVKVQVATVSAIHDAINRHYDSVEGGSANSIMADFEGPAGGAVSASLHEFTDTQIDYMAAGSDPMLPSAPRGKMRKVYARRSSPAPEPLFGPSDAPVVKLIQLIFVQAVQLKASHIIITPASNGVTLSYVIDGKVKERDRWPKAIEEAALSRLMILAKLNVADRKGLQTGNILIQIGPKAHEFHAHFSHKKGCTSILIVVSDAAVGTSDPEPVQKWWEDNGQQGP
jgi:Ca-activated chloride channel family protein